MQVGGPRVHCPRSRSTPSAGIVLEPISLPYRTGARSLPFHSGSSERSRYLRRGQFARPVDLAAHRRVVSPRVDGDQTVWLAPFFSFYEYRRICLLHLYVIRRIAAQRLKQGAYLGEVSCEGRDAILVQAITRCRPTQIALPRRPAKRLSRWPSVAIISIHAPLTAVGQSGRPRPSAALRCSNPAACLRRRISDRSRKHKPTQCRSSRHDCSGEEYVIFGRKTTNSVRVDSSVI